MHIFIDWLTYAHERALFKYKEDIEILNYNHLSDESRNTIKIEKERLEKSIREYDIFIKGPNLLDPSVCIKPGKGIQDARKWVDFDLLFEPGTTIVKAAHKTKLRHSNN